MELLKWLWCLFNEHTEVVLLGTVTLIQFAPIKIDPWTALFSWIGEMINGSLRKELHELRRNFEEETADSKRWNILDFANSCRNGREHTREEWAHVISQIKVYESYVDAKGLDNGVIEEESKYLRALYQKRLLKNDFL